MNVIDVEIKNATFSMDSFKAPGPDGFNGHFYHSTWGEVKFSVYRLVRDFFADCALGATVGRKMIYFDSRMG